MLNPMACYSGTRCMFDVQYMNMCGKKMKYMLVQNGDKKIVWPEFRTMCYLLQIYTDMTGLVVIIT